MSPSSVDGQRGAVTGCEVVSVCWRMTEEDGRARYGDAAEKVESTLEVRHHLGNTGDFLKAC